MMGDTSKFFTQSEEHVEVINGKTMIVGSEVTLPTVQKAEIVTAGGKVLQEETDYSGMPGQTHTATSSFVSDSGPSKGKVIQEEFSMTLVEPLKGDISTINFADIQQTATIPKIDATTGFKMGGNEFDPLNGSLEATAPKAKAPSGPG